VKLHHLRPAAIAVAASLFFVNPADALSIKEYRKFSPEQQSMYLIGAVSMTAFTYATNGDPVKARCVQNWYFGAHKGDETPGPHDLALEIAAAELVDAAKYHVEGVILGLTDKVCGQPKQ